jgi:two-component system sensor kinase FixL
VRILFDADTSGNSPPMSFVLPILVASATAIILLLLTMRHVARFISDAPATRSATAMKAEGVGFPDISVDAALTAPARAVRRSADQPVCESKLHPLAVCGKLKFAALLRAIAYASAFRRRVAYDSGAHVATSGQSRINSGEPANVENHFHEMLTSLPVAILTLNERGLMVMVNPRAARLFRYGSDELIGKPVELVIHGLRFSTNVVDPPDAFESQRPCTMTLPNEYSANRKDGTEFHVDVEFKAFYAGDENMTLAFISDRTDRYELDRSQQELVHLSRVSAMGQLVASLAHELNQPLTAILSNTHAAQRFMAGYHVDLVEVREILDDIVRDTYRAGEVIRRIRSGVRKSDPEVAPLYLPGLIRDVVLLVRNDAIVRGVRIALDVDNSLPPVQGDRVQLQQVLLNLLLNSFDAITQAPAIDRVVTVTLTTADTDMACISVRDCGHGLTTEKLDQIFKPFYTSKPHGLGLGLAISRSIIDMHHGRLWAENNIDRGATFFITLPTGDATERKQSR